MTVSKLVGVCLACMTLTSVAWPQTITGVSLTADTERKLKKIASAAGESSVDVTSADRSVAHQINTALDSYKGADGAYKVYGAPCRDAFKEATETQMVAKLTQILSVFPRPNCMRHVLGGGKVIDVAPSSVSNKKAFYDAVKASADVDQSRFYYPDALMPAGTPKSVVKDAAFHIEFK